MLACCRGKRKAGWGVGGCRILCRPFFLFCWWGVGRCGVVLCVDRPVRGRIYTTTPTTPFRSIPTPTVQIASYPLPYPLPLSLPLSCSPYFSPTIEAPHLASYTIKQRFDGVVGYHVSLTTVRTLKVSSSSLGRIISFCCRGFPSLGDETFFFSGPWMARGTVGMPHLLQWGRAGLGVVLG